MAEWIYPITPAQEWDRHIAKLDARDADEPTQEDRDNVLLCHADEFADWIYDSVPAFNARTMVNETMVYEASRKLSEDDDHAKAMRPAELLAIVLGVSPNPTLRIVAADELRRRFIEERGEK